MRLSETFIGDIIRFLHKTKFISFLQPIQFLFIAFGLLLASSELIINYQKADHYGKIALFFLPLAGFLNILLLLIFLDSLLSKRFNHKPKNWLAVCALVALPSSLLGELYNNLFFVLTDLVFSFVYIVAFLRHSIRR